MISLKNKLKALYEKKELIELEISKLEEEIQLQAQSKNLKKILQKMRK